MPATITQFMNRPQKENYTFEVQAYRLSDANVSTYYFSSMEGGYGTEPGDTPASLQFDNRIMTGYSRNAGSVGGQDSARFMSGFISRPGEGRLRLIQSFGDLDIGADVFNGVSIRDLSFGGRSAKIKYGGTCPQGSVPYEDYKIIETGVCVGEPRVHPGFVEFVIAGNETRFDSPAQSRQFYGTRTCGVFNGTTSHINCGNDSALNFTSGAFSVAFQIFIEAYPGSATRIMTRGVNATNGWDFTLSTTGQIQARTHQSGATQTTSSTPIPLHQWVQVHATRSGSGIIIYLDTEPAVDTAGVHINPTTTTNDFIVGANSGLSVFFEGALDDIRVMNSAMTPQAVEETSFQPLDPSEYSSYLVYLNLDDGVGALTAINQGSLSTAADGDITDVVIAPSCMGGSDIQARYMPDVWGTVLGLTPVCVDFAEQIYMVHASQIEAVDNVLLGGNYAAFDEGASSPYSSWLDFVVSTTTPGEYDVCNAPGWCLIRLGGQPEYALTLNVRGDKSDGTYRDTLGSLIRYIATTRGTNPLDDTDEILDSEFDDLEALSTDMVGLTYADDRSVMDVISEFARSLGLWVYFRRADSRLGVRQLDDPELGTPVATFVADDVIKSSLQVLDRGTPVWLTVGRFAENTTVLGNGDLYEGVDPETANFVQRQWRKTPLSRRGIQRRYKDALEYEFETRFLFWTACRLECIRRSELLRTPDQSFTFFVERIPTNLELLDVVIFHYYDMDINQVQQDRFGTSETSQFYITGIREDAKRSGYTIDVWRPRVV